MRKRVSPNQELPLKLSARERELILQHTFADYELTACLRVVTISNEDAVYAFTLDHWEELAGYVAAEANHTQNKKLQKELDRLFARIETVLESYTDEDARPADGLGHRIERLMPKPGKNRVREERIHEEVTVDAYGPEEQALAWYYYLENKIRFPFSARCIAAKVVSPLHKGETVAVRGLAPEDSCACDMLVLIRWHNRNVAARSPS